jgi:RNA polymerase sigma-70 factor, ECF subfamily
VQDTFERVLRKPRFLRRDQDVGYLLQVLRHTYFNKRRDRSRRPQEAGMPEGFEPAETRSTSSPEAALEAREVYAAIARLPDDYRDVITAVDVAGLSYAEAAKMLDVPQGTIMSRLYRARQQIARQLEGTSV